MVQAYIFGWNQKAKGNCLEIDTKGSGKMDFGMDTEYFTMQMVQNMKENGTII